jgi:hypothetical protein
VIGNVVARDESCERRKKTTRVIANSSDSDGGNDE